MILTSVPTTFLRFSRLSVSRILLPSLPNLTRPGKMDGLRAKMSALTPYAKKHKVTVIGSGNWLVTQMSPRSTSTDWATGAQP